MERYGGYETDQQLLAGCFDVFGAYDPYCGSDPPDLDLFCKADQKSFGHQSF